MPSNPQTISSFTNIPSRSDPSTFDAKTDSFLTQLNSFVTQTNSSITSTETNFLELYNVEYTTTETLTIDYGLKTFTITASKGDLVFVKLIAVEDSSKFMSGIVQSVTSSGNSRTYTVFMTELEGLDEAYSNWLVFPCSQPRSWNSRTAPSATTPAPMGSWWFDSNFFYFCVRDNTWRRTPLTTF